MQDTDNTKEQFISQLTELCCRLADLESLQTPPKPPETTVDEPFELAEALREATNALSVTLDFEVVLDRLLDQIARVVPFGARVPTQQSAVGWIIEQGQPFLRHNLTTGVRHC